MDKLSYPDGQTLQKANFFLGKFVKLGVQTGAL